jgi:hypothetical protein
MRHELRKRPVHWTIYPCCELCEFHCRPCQVDCARIRSLGIARMPVIRYTSVRQTLGNFARKHRGCHADLGLLLGAFECKTTEAFVHVLARLGGSSTGNYQLQSTTGRRPSDPGSLGRPCFTLGISSGSFTNDRPLLTRDRRRAHSR